MFLHAKIQDARVIGEHIYGHLLLHILTLDTGLVTNI